MKPVSALLGAGLACLSTATFRALTPELSLPLYIVTAALALGGALMAIHQLRNSTAERALIAISGASALLLMSIGGGMVVAYFLANAGWVDTRPLQIDGLFYQAFIGGPIMLAPGFLILMPTIRAINASLKR